MFGESTSPIVPCIEVKHVSEVAFGLSLYSVIPNRRRIVKRSLFSGVLCSINFIIRVRSKQYIYLNFRKVIHIERTIPPHKEEEIAIFVIHF